MRLAVPVKAIGQRFALPILVLASVAMIVLGKADALLFERFRSTFGDLISPVLAIVSKPVEAAAAALARFHDLIALYDENGSLPLANSRLLQSHHPAPHPPAPPH